MTANPNQHWGGENHTSVSRFVTRIAEYVRLKQLAVTMYKIHNNLSSPSYPRRIFTNTSNVHWVIPEKNHTPTTEGMLENLTGGGLTALEIQT